MVKKGKANHYLKLHLHTTKNSEEDFHLKTIKGIKSDVWIPPPPLNTDARCVNLS